MSGSILEAGEAVIVGVFLFCGGCAGVLLVIEGLKDVAADGIIQLRYFVRCVMLRRT